MILRLAPDGPKEVGRDRKENGWSEFVVTKEDVGFEPGFCVSLHFLANGVQS